MKIMIKSLTSLLLMFVFMLGCGLAALGADATNAVASPPAAVAKAGFNLAYLIPMIVPILLSIVKAVLPKIPKSALPILAPILGAGIDIGLHFAGQASAGPGFGAALGAAGVGVREALDQVLKAAKTPVAGVSGGVQ